MKFLEVPDYHFSPAWMDINERVAGAIAQAARENEVDFVAFPGDIYDRSLQASDRGGLNHLREQIRQITSICPAVAVYGTPSHEPPGSLENLEDCGLTILRPGRVYALLNNMIIQLNAVDATPIGTKAILFGIPEINKHNIQAKLSLSADQANAEAVNLFYRYIEEFIAPMRMQYTNIPAVVLFHGNVSDSRHENETDIIKRASDIVVHTERMQAANIDRWTLGHIHTPWESTEICAGYAGYPGIDSNPWGKLGFVPAMNLVETYEQHNQEMQEAAIEENMLGYIAAPPCITRIPYGTPERRKITKPAQATNPDIAYWLCSDDPDAKLPAEVHPWSRTTYNSQRQETRRVTREEAANVKSLRDLFKLIDPEVTESILTLVDGMVSTIGIEQHEPTTVQIQSVEVEGCIFFKGKKYSMSIDQLHAGLNQIRGNNGSGKSSGLAFWTPYPIIVGKDTKSGRASAIKDFFDSPDSIIRKRLTLNGIPHEHTITIRGAHTQNPKTECYLSIDGVPKLDKGTFDEMHAACESLYGPYVDYLPTAFYVQPLQGKTQSSLMSASMTDIRNLVQSIAGIDRENEKRYALDQVKLVEKTISDLTAWLAGAQEFRIDIPALESELLTINKDLVTAQKQLIDLTESGKLKRIEYDAAVAENLRSDMEAQKKRDDESRGFDLEAEKNNKQQQINEWSKSAGELETNREKIKLDDQRVKINGDNAIIRAENDRLKREYDHAIEDELREIRQKNEDLLREYTQIKQQFDQDIKTLKQEVSSLESQSQQVLVKCSNCGYVEPEAQQKSDTLTKQAKEKTELLENRTRGLAALKRPIPLPEIHDIPDPKYQAVGEDVITLSDSERTTIQESITTGMEATANIKAAQTRIAEIETEIIKLANREYDVNPEAEKIVAALNQELETLREEHSSASATVSTLETQAKNTTDKITKGKEVESKIIKSEEDLDKSNILRNEWDYIARMLQASKIPAMELELVLDAIDDTATRVISPFEQSRYSYHTETQQQGKAGVVDRFDIRVHDSETGRDKSLLEHSPGEKAFFSDAYVKALIEQRNQRAQRSYDPMIMDESDGPIQPERIAAYYEMQANYWQGNTRVIVVSHSPASHEHIEHGVNIEEVLI